MSDPDLTCPNLAWLPWWNAALAYDTLAEEQPDWAMPVTFEDPETGATITQRMTADDMCLHHLLLSWGYDGGHL